MGDVGVKWSPGKAFPEASDVLLGSGALTPRLCVCEQWRPLLATFSPLGLRPACEPPYPPGLSSLSPLRLLLSLSHSNFPKLPVNSFSRASLPS